LDRSCDPTQLLFSQQYLLGRRAIRQEIHSPVELFAKSPFIARLTISGLVMNNAKQPATDVFLVSSRRQMALQADKRVLHHILRFVARKSKADKVAQQRFS
jgi:hypothetical protein